VPWEVLAADLGVARQSLHRRLSRKIRRYMLSNPVIKERGGPVSEWEALRDSLSGTVEGPGISWAA